MLPDPFRLAAFRAGAHGRIVAVEMQDPFTMSTDIARAVERAIEITADKVIDCAREFSQVQPST